MLENDNTVSRLKKVVNIKFSKENTHLIETSYDRLKSREITFQQYRKILLKQEFSDGLNIHMNAKDITIPLIIHYYLLSIEDTTNLSTLNHNVRFLPCQHRALAYYTIRVRAKPCVHHLIVPGHSHREVPRQNCGHS